MRTMPSTTALSAASSATRSPTVSIPAARCSMKKAGAALAAQYDGYSPFPDAHVNGKLTLGENIADVAGIATAFDAYTLSRQGKPSVDLEGLSPDQRFFLGFAQVWRSKAREASLRNSLLTGVHAPGRYRAETVRNQDPWYEAFDVK